MRLGRLSIAVVLVSSCAGCAQNAWFEVVSGLGRQGDTERSLHEPEFDRQIDAWRTHQHQQSAG